MKRNSTFDADKFDHALSDAFREAPECGAFGTFDDLTRRRMINGILSRAALESEKNAASKATMNSRRQLLAWIAASAAVVVAGLLGVLLLTAPQQSQNEEAISSVEFYFGEVRQSKGLLYIGGKEAVFQAPVPVGKTIHTKEGNALLGLPTGIEWWISNQSRVEISSIDQTDLKVRIIAGENWFRVDPKRQGPSFSVQIESGLIEVTGTIFMVNADIPGTEVTVWEGKVRVTNKFGQTILVEAGQMLRLSENSQYELSDEEKQMMHAKLIELAWSDKEYSSKKMDNEKDLRITAANTNENRELQSKQSLQTKETSVTDIRQLHEEIQRCRQKGDWERTASLYQKLIQSAPTSETALVSRVSLAELYLTKLYRYKEALTHFDRYLQSNHTALTPEAFYGKCRTLKALNRKKQEEQCLELFTSKFSNSLQTREAKARLDILRSDKQI